MADEAQDPAGDAPETSEGEGIEAARAQAAAKKAAKEESERRGRMLKAGIGIGIGSAAVVAALLYANQSRKKTGGKKED